MFKVEHKGSCLTVEINDIEYFATCERGVALYAGKNKHEFGGKLSEVEKRLAGYDFVRCHQSFLVNMHHIAKIERMKWSPDQARKNTLITLKSGRQLPLSKHREACFKKRYNDYLMRHSV